MREVELSLNGTLREIFSFGESRGAFDRFLPSMCVMAEAQRYRPFGHKVDDFDIALDGTTAVHAYMGADHTKATAPFPNCPPDGPAYRPAPQCGLPPLRYDASCSFPV